MTRWRRVAAAAALGAAFAGCDKKPNPPPGPGTTGTISAAAETESRARFKEGEALLRRGDGENAIRAFLAAADADPRFFPAWYRWHEAMCAASREKDAKDEFSRRLAAAPEDAFWLTLNALAEKEGREARLKLAIQKSPEFAWAHSTLAETLLEQKRYDEAIRSADRALQLSPDNGLFHLQKAVALMGAGKSADALAETDRAKAGLPGDERVLIVRAQILIGDDRPDEARAALEEAVKLAPAANSAKIVLRDLRVSAAKVALKEYQEAFDGGRYGSAADAAQRAAGVLEDVERDTPGDEVAMRYLPQAETAAGAALLKRANDALRDGRDEDGAALCDRAQPWFKKAGTRKLDDGARDYLAQMWLRLGALEMSSGQALKDRGSPKANDRFQAALAAFEACTATDPSNKAAPAMAAEAKKAMGK